MKLILPFLYHLFNVLFYQHVLQCLFKHVLQNCKDNLFFPGYHCLKFLPSEMLQIISVKLSLLLLLHLLSLFLLLLSWPRNIITEQIQTRYINFSRFELSFFLTVNGQFRYYIKFEYIILFYKYSNAIPLTENIFLH